MATNLDLHLNETSEDVNECSCPICLRTITEMQMKVNKNHDSSGPKVVTNNGTDFVYSRTCGHMFCLTCIQQILLASSYAKRTRTMQYLQEGEPIITTTQGACPMCRAELSYFDLMKVSMENSNESKINDGFILEKIVKSDDPVVASSDPIPIQLLGSKFLSKDDSYVQFPSTMNDIVTLGITLYVEYFKEFVPTGVLVLTECTFLAFTNTFKATAKKIDTMPDTEITVWLNFSDNFQFITHGVCRKVDQKEFFEDVADESKPQHRMEVKTFVYPISVTYASLMCRVRPTTIPRDVPSTTNSFWGNIFCQQFMIGLASYHFVKKPDVEGRDDGAIAYICYDHKMTSAWPPLDNGRPIPSRVFFRNISSPDPYTFRGSICWYEDYQTTWNGCSRWDYEMKFDTTFVCIRSGTVHSISMSPDDENESEAGIVSIMSKFGVELNYINAGVCDSIIGSILSTFVGGSKGQQVAALLLHRARMDLVLNEMQERLEAEGVTESTLSSLLYVVHLAIQNTISTLLDYCQRDPSEQDGDIKLEEYPFDLDYYFD